MPRVNEGGRHALAGFLYQIIGTWGLIVAAHQIEETSLSDKVTASLDVSQDTNVVHEAYGQDAAILGPHERKLVQFKYSSRPTVYPIQASELMDIARAFENSARTANEDECLAVDYILFSNRELSTSSGQMLRAVHDVAFHRMLGGPEEDRIERTILKKMRYHCVNLNDWINALSTYGKALGLTDRELDHGVTSLVGQLVQDGASSGATPISREYLDERLTGFPSPHLLTRRDIKSAMETAIGRYRIATRAPDSVLRRSIVREIERSKNHAMVVVYGEGGCGKSVAVCDALQEFLCSGSNPPEHYVAANFAVQLPQVWLSEIVAKWRGAPSQPYYSELPETALARLERAHATATRPILILALDGLDEASGAGAEVQHRIRSVFQFISDSCECIPEASDSPRIVLVVTCRRPEDMNLVWRHRERFEPEDLDVRLIPVTDFSDTELAEAAEHYLPQSVAERITVRARRNWIQIERTAGTSTPYSLETIGTSFIGTDPVVEDVYDYLKHPLFWRFFSDIQDEGTQHRILNAEQSDLWRVCENYIGWFFDKATARNPVFDANNARAMLSLIAGAFGDPTRQARQSRDWTEVAASDHRFNEQDARRLFDEAASFGLVNIISAGTWRWRSPIMCQFLSTQSLQVLED